MAAGVRSYWRAAWDTVNMDNLRNGDGKFWKQSSYTIVGWRFGVKGGQTFFPREALGRKVTRNAADVVVSEKV